MRLFVAGLVTVLAGGLTLNQVGLPDFVFSSELLTGIAAAIILAGIWLLIDAARLKHSQAKLQLEAGRLAQELAQARRDAAEAAVQAADQATAAAAQAADRAMTAAKASALAEIAKAGKDEVIHLLSLLQQKGRFLDFVMDDVTKYPDAQIGAAARVVHQGCAAVVREYFDIKPVHEAAEGAALTLAKDYDALRYRVIGRMTGEPPYRGRVLHRGWQTLTIKLPERVAQRSSHEVIAPAEVELS